jgi:hypothetical protein
MYNGIEISHPIYATLFCNMVITLLSSVIDVFIFPFVTNFKYSTLVNGNSVLCLLFHFCSWFVLSVLRYFYIVYPDQLHQRFPEPKVLSSIAIISDILIFTINCAGMLGTLMYFGWPQIKMYYMPTTHKIISISTILSIYVLLLSLSCCFYILILRKRGKLGINQVAVLNKEEVGGTRESSSVKEFGGIWTGSANIHLAGTNQVNTNLIFLQFSNNLTFNVFVLISIFYLGLSSCRSYKWKQRKSL